VFERFFRPSPLSSDPSSYLRLGVFLAAALTASQLIEAKRRIEDTLRRTQTRLSRATQTATPRPTEDKRPKWEWVIATEQAETFLRYHLIWFKTGSKRL
jgi:hypothetical protein